MASRIFYLFQILLVLFISFSLHAEDQPRKYVMCRNGKTIRTIRVETIAKDPGQCVTTYTKDGHDQVVGGGRNPASCDGVLDRVQKTLEEHSWKCRDMDNAIIHRDTAGN